MKIKAARFIASSVIGGAYGVAALFIGRGILSVFLTFALPLLMCFIAYGKSPPLRYIKSVILFFASSALLGGLMTALFRLFGKIGGRGVYINGEMYEMTGDIPFGYFIIAAAAAAIIAAITGRLFKKKSGVVRLRITLLMFGRKIEFSALEDSGNLLTEPLSGSAVILVSYKTVRPILPPVLRRFYENKEDVNSLPDECSRLVRAVFVKSAGGEGMIYALRPECITVNGKERECLIGVDTKNEDYSGNDAICPSVLAL